MLEILVQDTGEFRYSKVLPDVQKKCKTVWKLGGASNFLLRKKTAAAGRSGSTKKIMYFVTTPKVNST